MGKKDQMPSTGTSRETGTARGAASYRYGDKLPAASLMLEELLKATEIHQLFESYYNLIKIPVAIIDLDANVLFSSRWQRICTQFHRVHPATCARCVECDTKLALRLDAGQTHTIYPCMNGLTDCASPIVIEGRHIANLFIGQFLTQAPDEARFRRQAEEFGFDVDDYLAALREVPVVDEHAVPSILDLLARMTRVITNLSIERKQVVDDHTRQLLILDTIPQSVFWKDLQGRYLGCNAAFSGSIGLAAPSEVVGKTDFDLPWPRPEADAYRADDQGVIASGQPRLHIVEPLQRADGSRIVVDTSKFPLTDAGGNPCGIVGIYEDITERKRIEDELNASEDRYRKLFEASPDGIILVGRDGRVERANTAQARLYRYDSPAEMIGIHVTQFIASSMKEYAAGIVRRRLSGEDVPPVEYECIRKDRSTFLAEVVVTNLRGADGAVAGYICTTRDVTERKRAELELQERLRLEVLVADLAARFVTVDVDNLDREITVALQRICECIDIDVCGIWQMPDSDASTLVLTHMVRRQEGPPIPASMHARDYFPWVEERLRTTGLSFVLSDAAELPLEAVRDREVYGLFGIESALCVPSFGADGRLSGVVACNCTVRRTWTPMVVSRVEMLARIILMALARIRVERSMTASRKRMSLLTEMLDEAPVGVLVHDEKGGILYANRHVASLHGYTAEELGSLSLADLLAQDAREEMGQHLREIAERGEALFDIWHVRKDRSAVHLHVVARRTLWLDRPAVLSVEADLTERERSASALLESEERYRLLAERIADVVWVLDPASGKCLYVSPSVERLRGYTVEEAMAQPLEASLAPESRESMRIEAYRALQCLAGGEHVGTFGVHIVHQTRKDGSTVPTEVTMECIRDQATGKPLILGVSRDITERMEAERSRQELQGQLLQAQKMEAIGRLAGGISHDFNNLLSVILSYTGFVMSALAEGDPRRRDLEEVKKAAARAAALTRQLLAFSRKQVFQPVPLDLNQIAKGVEKMLQRILGEDIELVQVLAPDLGTTLADPGQIEQVLMNLVVNARDAMPDGGKLTIETCNVELGETQAASFPGVKPGAYVQLSVTDTGCGMDKQTQARIFEPFFTTKEKGKGTGLGLSTVFGIVKQSGGDIQVLSEPGQGSTFQILLPREVGGAAPMAMRATAGPPALATGDETVLVVEDEEALRNVARRVLMEAGYSVLVAANGDEALRICEQNAGKIHLVLTDVVMPGMSGSILTSRLAESVPGARVLYMSGYTDDAIVHHGVIDPGVHFIAKPFTPPDLARKVREVLDWGTTKPSTEHEDAVKADGGTGRQPHRNVTIGALPQSIVAKLREAVTAARYDDIIEIVENIRSSDPGLATELRRMADIFDYGGMRHLLDSEAGK